MATGNEAITIRYPECMKESNILMQKINNKHELKVRRACKVAYLLQIEFRKRKRKPTNFEGVDTRSGKGLNLQRLTGTTEELTGK